MRKRADSSDGVGLDWSDGMGVDWTDGVGWTGVMAWAELDRWRGLNLRDAMGL